MCEKIIACFLLLAALFLNPSAYATEVLADRYASRSPFFTVPRRKTIEKSPEPLNIVGNMRGPYASGHVVDIPAESKRIYEEQGLGPLNIWVGVLH